ncbi:MAG: branched-chain amino acid ABC transporter permease, partial [Chloroflexota bacterium]|nr:branched-chain amino acid ABC transporter permease [Chloroflexota bacterium]
AFEFSISVIVLAMVILGGSASIPGVILGGLVIKLVDLLILDKLQLVIGGLLRATVLQSANEGFGLFLSSLFDVTQYKLLLFGLILVIMMLVRPQGLVPASVVKYDTKA